jgi:hypothetical protein
MSEWLGSVAMITASFFGSLAVAYTVTRLRRRSVEAPKTGTPLRIRTTSGVARTRFIEARKGSWIIEPPMAKGTCVPFRPGESLVLEQTGSRGAWLYRCHVLTRDAETQTFELSVPDIGTLVDRRVCHRHAYIPPKKCRVDGARAWMHDISEFGSRIEVTTLVAAGDRVRIDVDEMDEPIFADVIDRDAQTTLAAACATVRVCFEQAIHLTD